MQLFMLKLKKANEQEAEIRQMQANIINNISDNHNSTLNLIHQKMLDLDHDLNDIFIEGY